jgi:hypothetical protein
MRSFRSVFLAGAAVIALAGFAGFAAAAIRNAHVLTVRLPGGSVEQIRYTGDTPPQVSLEPGSAPSPAAWPVADPFGFDSPFAAVDRISAEMDRQAEAMLNQAMAPALTGPDGLVQADLGRLPPGVHGYSVVSTRSGNAVCTHSVQYTAYGPGKPPRVVTRTSGNCGADQSRPLPSAAPGAVGVPPGSHLLQASYTSAAGAEAR